MSVADPLYAALLTAPQDRAEQALALRYAPLIQFDSREPFMPLAAGYTIFRADAPSPSFARPIRLAAAGRPSAALVIEYAIWWDWDIGHLYELEHVWVYVDAAGQVIFCEASSHGGYHAMLVDGRFAQQGDQVILLSEPGKHAFGPHPAWYDHIRAPHPRTQTNQLAGEGGVLVNSLFKGQIADPTPHMHTLARTYLQSCAFAPAWDFAQPFTFALEQLMPWDALRAWIPGRIAWWLDQLEATLAPADYCFMRVGHRGASGHAPDNTLAGIRQAAALGADRVEIDVQLTGDGVVVASHDLALPDANGQLWPIASSTLAQLQAIDLGGGERMPTFTQVIGCCRQERIELYVELKDSRSISQTVALLATYHMSGDVIIGSFRPDWLAEVRALAPHIATSVLFSSLYVNPVALAQAVGATYVHPCWENQSSRPDQFLSAAWLARVRAAGLGVVCWHEERPAVISALRQLGVDAICSDLPELFGQPAALQSSDLWLAPKALKAICFDFGDTLADEASEEKDETQTTQSAELIPGVAVLLRELYQRGYKLALVANGRPGTYVNTLKQHGLYQLFQAFAISELLNTNKPDRRMFDHALQLLGVPPAEYGQTIMVGNDLFADMRGANGVGMISVWLNWSPRRSKTPADASEVPDYTIKMPLELLEVIEAVEAKLAVQAQQRMEFGC